MMGLIILGYLLVGLIVYCIDYLVDKSKGLSRPCEYEILPLLLVLITWPGLLLNFFLRRK